MTMREFLADINAHAEGPDPNAPYGPPTALLGDFHHPALSHDSAALRLP